MLGQIIRAAGRREAAPAAIRNRVLAAATAALDARLARRRRSLAWGSAVAAAILVTAGGFALQTLRITTPVQVAVSDRSAGEALVRQAATAEWAPLVGGSRLMSGTELRTGTGGRIGLVLDRGVSLRLNEQTLVRLELPMRIRVLDGTVYVDSGRKSAADGAPAVEILSGAAITRDIGTQFEVRYHDGLHRLRIREGRVLMRLGGSEFAGEDGEEVMVSSRGDVRRAVIAATDPAWQWVELVASAPAIDNRPLIELLEWVSRETGRPLRYASAAIQAQARATILHGNIDNLTPLPAARTALATTDLDLEILTDGSLLVKGRSPGVQYR